MIGPAPVMDGCVGEQGLVGTPRTSRQCRDTSYVVPASALPIPIDQNAVGPPRPHPCCDEQLMRVTGGASVVRTRPTCEPTPWFDRATSS